jgi:site-specific DNA-cytosine methylase
MNTVNAKRITAKATSASGASTLTLHASVRYIQMKRPKVCFLENVYKTNSVDVARLLLRRVGSYAIWPIVLNAAASPSCRSSRTRIYIIAVDLQQVTIRTSMREWQTLLIQMVRSQPPLDLEGLLLKPDDPWLDVALQCPDKKWKQRQRAKWVKCERWHALARRQLSKRFGVQVPSSIAMIAQVQGENKWLKGLSPREADLFGLHEFAAAQAGMDLSKDHFMINVTNNVYYQQKKHSSNAGLLGCLCRSHKWVDTKLRRSLTGLEKMRIQGFASVRLSGAVRGCSPTAPSTTLHLTDKELAHLAGDTMCVPIMGCLITLILSTLDLDQPSPSHVTAKHVECPQLAAGGVLWIGKRSYAGPASQVDKIVDVGRKRSKLR